MPLSERWEIGQAIYLKKTDFRFQQSINNYKKVGNKKKQKKTAYRVYNGMQVKGSKGKRTNNKSPLLPTIMSERPVFKIW